MTLAREAFAATLGRAPAQQVIRAARDPVKVPDEERYTRLLADSFVVAAVGVNCYVLTNMYDDSRVIPFGCTFADWQYACSELLELNITKAAMDPDEQA